MKEENHLQEEEREEETAPGTWVLKEANESHIIFDEHSAYTHESIGEITKEGDAVQKKARI